ncbi:hypothetical protein TIFTF001_005337 [Ficus carica]|uniref:DUF3741 domain-containing protein n=1 Tax=Ficus carica TaxID=3494 RepID=A0AA87ZJD2_FICCA|nr:hypothetical protein TIFTF001_005337 [Ficus carica]
MAKRSDFAQKLLDDLRLRKERMAASSQSSNRSNSMAIIDAYSYAKQNYRGSKDMIGSRTGNARTKSDISSISSFSREAAQQIVPYGRGQGSQQMGDLSRALALALENGGKVKRTDSSTRNSMLGFLQQIGMRPVDISKMGRRSDVSTHQASTSQLPTFSPLQIEEISKGAQRLNQILRACSNGVNFDRYSIEIGKELLKGAIDLENSLKMLVNLQEASEYMVTPQRKNQIKLLEEGEEDEEGTENIAEEWRLDLPRFSFDKSSRYNIRELERTGLNQRLPALPDSRERTNSSVRSVSHSRSASYSSNVKSVSIFSEQKNQPSSSESKSEKARIPNVIAKLMGLEKLPESEKATNTAHKNSRSKPKDEGERSRKATQETAKIVGQKATGVENQASPKKQKLVVEANKNHIVQNTSFVFVKEKSPPSNFSFEVVFDDEKLPWENSQGNKAAARSEKAIMRKEEHQSVVIPIKQNTGNRMVNKEKERNQEIKKNTEVDTRTSFEASHLMQQKRQAEKQSPSRQKKTQNNIEIQQPQMHRKSVSEEKDLSAKQISQARKQKGSEIMSKSLKQNKKSMKKSTNLIQSEGFPNGRHQGDLVRERSTAELNVNTESKNWNPDQNLSPRVQPESETRKERARARVPPAMDEKAVHVPIVHKAKTAPKVQKIESPRRIEEVVARRNGTLSSMTRPLRHQNSVLKEVKPRRLEKVSGIRLEEAEPQINESNIVAANDQVIDLAQQMNKEAEKATTLCISKEDGFSSLKEPQKQASNDISQNAILTDQQDPAPAGKDQELKCRLDVPNELNVAGIHGETIDISSTPDTKHEMIIERIEPISKPDPEPEPLTETENHLKQTIIKSQLFLNTAEALFKLDTPTNILHADGHDHQDHHHEDKKLILDCGYELMRRKGRRQELAVHPCVKVSTSLVKITTFDGLVRELSKGFERLRLYGRNGKEDCEADEYLPRMLESDVYNKDPDMNCMWDIGWNENMFAFIEVDEVVRDVEKHLLNGLLDDITRELFFSSMSVY